MSDRVIPIPQRRECSVLVRIAAGALDRIAFFAVGAVLTRVILGPDPVARLRENRWAGVPIAPLTVALVSLLPLALWGSTAGKGALRLKVVPVRGGPWAAAAKRSLVGLVAIASPGITMVAYAAWCVANVLVLATRKDGRSLYDQVAGTRVVSVSRTR